MIDVLEVLFWLAMFIAGGIALGFTSSLFGQDNAAIAPAIVFALAVVWAIAVAFGYHGDDFAMWEWMWRVWLALIWLGAAVNVAIDHHRQDAMNRQDAKDQQRGRISTKTLSEFLADDNDD